MLYKMYEWNHAAMVPFRLATSAAQSFWSDERNPMAQTAFGRSTAAALELFERTTRRYGKPEFGLTHTVVAENEYEIREHNVMKMPFGTLLHFNKLGDVPHQEKLLIVAPMSGHYATLLRGTVEAMLPHFDVYITDWADARDIPLSQGHFDLDDYTDYVIEFLRHIGTRAHVMAVCQPSVPVLAAVSMMNADKDPLAPLSMILMGGPIDTASNPTGVNKMAHGKSVAWFERNAVMEVPFPLPGFGRKVYPGFMQLTGFMTMNLDRHMTAHRDLFWHLVEGDDDSAEKHRDFYDEYQSVMDLSAEFYLQTVQRVFINQHFPKGTYHYRGRHVEPGDVRQTALLTIEGEKDDISGVGQTEAAHRLCSSLSDGQRHHHLQMGVGHYGVFSGSRFRRDVVPVITQFCKKFQARAVAGEGRTEGRKVELRTVKG
jgi:poly(3-hydroxybutyrate) depolymerase